MLNALQQNKAMDKRFGVVNNKTSAHAIKNQMLASSLLKGRKNLGLNKAVVQSFLKRFVTPYGSNGLHKNTGPLLRKQMGDQMQHMASYVNMNMSHVISEEDLTSAASE